MTNINFPSSGGSSVLSYVISDCLGADSISFVASDNWYSLVHDISARTVTITVQSSLSDSARTSDIIVSINGNSCPSKNVVIIQDGLLPCDCNSFVDFSQLLFEIDASGMTSGTVVGTYSLLGSNCDDEDISFDVSVITPESGQYYGGSFDLVAINGNIILASDVIANLNSGITTFDVDIYYGDSKCRSFSVVQDGTEVTCECGEHIEYLISKYHQYFSNYPYSTSSSTTRKYTVLNNVLIASGSTACGTFTVGEPFPTGISSAWTVTDDSHVYIYANIESNSGDGRSMAVNVYYKTRDNNDCGYFSIILYQGNSDYFNCRTLKNSNGCDRFIYDDTGNSTYNDKNQWIVMHTYEWTGSSQPTVSLESDYYNKKLKIIPIFEIGYCDIIRNNRSKWETENEDPMIDIDPSDVTDFSYSAITNGIRMSFKFKGINSAETKFRYAKVYLDLYTDDGNVYCCTPATYYWIQGAYECCDCSLIPSGTSTTTNLNGNATSGTVTGIGFTIGGQYSSIPCAYGIYMDSVRLEPSSAGTISSVSYDTNTGGISAFTYEIYENDDAERNINIIEVLKCSGDSSGCDYVCGKYKQAKLNCNCNDLLRNVNHTGVRNVVDICSGYTIVEQKTVPYFSSQSRTVYFGNNLMPYVTTSTGALCTGATAYMVLCDASGNTLTLPSDRWLSGECANSIGSPKNKFRFGTSVYHYDNGRGYLLQTVSFSSLKTEISISEPDETLSSGSCYNVYVCQPSFYYRIDIYRNGTLNCSSPLYCYANKAKFIIKSPKENCECEVSCNSFTSFTYTLNTSMSTCTIDGEEYVLISSGGGRYFVATFSHLNGADLTEFGICSGIGSFVYSVNSTTSSISCDVMNDELWVTIPSFDTQSKRTFTCDINYGYDISGVTTICDTYLTINFLQCGNEYENCSCSNES